jgi:proteasome accessory factor B
VAVSKVERLMNLVIALLATDGYLTAERIRANVYGYGDSPSDDAFSRMFERDKNELRDLGIPLETGRISTLDPTEGYRINKAAYALPDIDLTADEAAAVAVAAQLWQSPELITAAQGALLKLRAAGTDVDPDAAVAIVAPRMFWVSCRRRSTPAGRCSSSTARRVPPRSPSAASSPGR